MNNINPLITCEKCGFVFYSSIVNPLAKCPKCKHRAPQKCQSQIFAKYFIYVYVGFILLIIYLFVKAINGW